MAGTDESRDAATPASNEFDFLEPAQESDELGRLAFYRILRKVGEGATSLVFKAEDTRLKRFIALKVLKPELARDQLYRERFHREARAAASVRDDHVEHIHHVGQHRNLPFIELEFLEGETLQARLRRESKLELAEVLRLGREIAHGLSAAHARGLIHRDIKPANNWLEPSGLAKVLDFGLARTIDPRDRYTETGHAVGTPLYMSPEQASGGEVDHRSDIYSLGCVIYEMASGRVPLQRQPLSVLLEALASEEPEPLRRHSNAPPALDQLVQRMLAKQPIDRPQSAQQVVESLAAIEREQAASAAGQQPAVRPRPPETPQPRPEFVRGNRPSFEQETLQLLRHRLKTVALVMLVCQTVSFVNAVTWHNNILLSLRLLMFAINVVAYMILAGTRPFTLWQMRWWELGVFGPTVILLLTEAPLLIYRFAHAGDRASAVVSVSVTHSIWATFIMLYAMLVPNTWRRAALILLPAALAPTLLCEVMLYYDEVLRRDLQSVPFLRTPLHWSTLAGLIGIYGVHIIHSLRQSEFQHRQLGEYVLLERIGAGPHGEVYRAEHRFLQRPCAVKLIQPGGELDADSLCTFEQHVLKAARLAHWNVVEVYDLGHRADGQFYYAMAEITGFNLADLVEQSGALPAGRAIYLLQQICDALDEAHRAGLVHGNLKPTNVLVTRSGNRLDVVKVADFGPLERGDTTYHSPEQMKQAGSIDQRSDIYSLGAVAYFLLTGKPPFTAPTPLELMAAQLRDAPTPPSELCVDVPADLEQVVLRCLEKDPRGRFETAAGLARALAHLSAAGTWSDRDAALWWGDSQ
ncbi:MAG: serine/threonine-protein kinase [Gemmataceae bacterium]